MKTRPRTAERWRTAIPHGLLLATILLPSTPASSGPDCYSATVPSEIALPDGSLHPKGELRICKRSAGSDLHLVRVNGHPVGVFAAREGPPIAGGKLRSHIVFVFVRDSGGALRLAGLAQLKDGRYRVFHLTTSTEWVQALEVDSHGESSAPFVRVAAVP